MVNGGGVKENRSEYKTGILVIFMTMSGGVRKDGGVGGQQVKQMT